MAARTAQIPKLMVRVRFPPIESSYPVSHPPCCDMISAGPAASRSSRFAKPDTAATARGMAAIEAEDGKEGTAVRARQPEVAVP
jgi:hypothetical protein